MRRRKNKNKNQIHKIGTVIVFLGVFGISVGIPGMAIANADLSWEGVIKKIAVASVMYNMPENTLDLLEERFNEEIISQEEINAEELPLKPEPPEIKPTQKPIIGESSDDLKHSIILNQEENNNNINNISQEYQGNIIEENMSVSGGTAALPCYSSQGEKSNGFIKNSTKISNEQIDKILKGEDKVKKSILKNSKEPQVLIMHTHATESFEKYDSDTYDTRGTWRTTDNTKNIVAVGEEIAKSLRAKGIETIHDETQHDYPSYNGSYERSEKTVKEYLKKYPTIKIVLDVHRDAVQRGTTLVKPVTEINGKKVAQLMIISGCDDGTMNMPNWETNLRFASGIQNAIENKYPTLTRPVFFCYRKYNQNLTTGSLLIEFGSHGNTLDEVMQTASLAGEAIANYLCENAPV